MRVPEESISLFTMGTLRGAAQDHEEEQAIELSIWPRKKYSQTGRCWSCGIQQPIITMYN
jgi:hypothetical protein